MKKLLLFSLACVSALQAQSVNSGSVQADNISHTSARIEFQTSGAWYYARLRVTNSPGTCTDGTSGVVKESMATGGGSLYGTLFNVGNIIEVSLFQLSPNTAYSVCPEISADNATWHGGQAVTFTTDPMPQVHPQLPIPAKRFDTSYPDTTGYNAVSVASNDDCSSIKNAINNAVSVQTTQGTIINVPAGSTCIGHIRYSRVAPDLVHVPNGNFNTANSQIAIPNHGLQEGATVAWGATDSTVFGGGYSGGGILPGQPNGWYYPSSGLPFAPGTPTYVHVIDANTIQIYANAPLGTACNPGHTDVSTGPSQNPEGRVGGYTCPTLWQFNSQGNGAVCMWRLPRPLKWVIIRTSTPDSQFLPEHVRLQGPIDATGAPMEPTMWLPKMASIQAPISYRGNPRHTNIVFSPEFGDSGDAAFGYFGSHIRFVGIEFTYQPHPAVNYLQDIPPGEELWTTGNLDSDIIVDRCWIHGRGGADRAYRVLDWDGHNIGIVDSYLNGLQMPRQILDGITVHK